MWLDPGAPPQLAGLHIPPIGSQLVHSLSIVYPLKLIRAGCGTRFRGMRSLTSAACGKKTLFSIIFTTSPLAKSWIRACRPLRWVYTFDAVKRFDTLSYAAQMRIKAFCGVSVYTFHAGISARQRARESVARRKMLQSSTVLNFHALHQRTPAIQPIIYRCHELSLQRIDLAITSESSHWTFSSWRWNRKAHVIAVKVQS